MPPLLVAIHFRNDNAYDHREKDKRRDCKRCE